MVVGPVAMTPGARSAMMPKAEDKAVDSSMNAKLVAQEAQIKNLNEKIKKDTEFYEEALEKRFE